ncbi:MAG: NYN domain-containing protein [Geminicoccaceae bacterium]
MSGDRKFAILMDGGFVTKKLAERHKKFPNVTDIDAECARITGHAALSDYTLLRIYFYDAKPATDQIKNPLDGKIINLGSSPVHARNTSLQQSLELRQNVAFRAGETVVHGWQLGYKALANLAKKAGPLNAKDLVPNVEQKGVDLRIGLDIARLSLCKLVDIIVLVTGDSDFIPAMKFARREGVRVYLDHMNHGVKRDLKVHADLIL